MNVKIVPSVGRLSALPNRYERGWTGSDNWKWFDVGVMTHYENISNAIIGFRANTIFLHGTSNEITTILAETVKLDQSLFNENYSWWASLTVTREEKAKAKDGNGTLIF